MTMCCKCGFVDHNGLFRIDGYYCGICEIKYPEGYEAVFPGGTNVSTPTIPKPIEKVDPINNPEVPKENSQIKLPKGITWVEGTIYSVQSKSDPNKKYNVDVELGTCECVGFSWRHSCSHLDDVIKAINKA